MAKHGSGRKSVCLMVSILPLVGTALVGCAKQDLSSTDIQEATVATSSHASTKEARTTRLDAPASLRAATIAALQSNASVEYDFDEAWDEPGVLVGSLPTQGLAVRASTRGVELGPEGEPAHLGMRLKAAGCQGQVLDANAAAPNGELNRARYAHELEGGRAVEAWYLSGPLGLEQGFTLDADWACATTELVVGVEGATVEVAGDGFVLTSAQGGARYRYGNLFAYDATGKELVARMDHRADGTIGLVVETRGAVFPVVVDPLVATQQAKLVAGDAAPQDNFGYSLALDGDTALIGSLNDDNAGGAEAGSAYIFVRTGSTWIQQAKLVASDASPGDRFGSSVALSADTAVVGALYDDHSGSTDAGSAYVFVRNGGTWLQQAKLVADDAAANDYLGFSVATDGDTALLGARSDDHAGGTDAGSAYVFVRNGGTWSQQAKLVAGDAAANDNFGFSVSIAGDTALLGAVTDDHGGGVDAGSVYVFVRTGSTWLEQTKLVSSDAAAADLFGYSVVLNGDTALVGAEADDEPSGMNTGSAYVFVRTGPSWTEQAKLVANDAAAIDSFGHSVALSGNSALVGAVYGDAPGAGNSGCAYVFARSGSTWTQQAKLTASDAATNDYFGVAVAMSGDTATLAAYGNDNVGYVDAGSAYVFTLETKLDPGAACSTDSQCLSAFCADGVCCNSTCGGSDGSDCQACSLVAGGTSDGTCGPRVAATVCRAAVGSCDAAETCNGSSTTCPVDAAQPAGTACGGAPNGACDAQDVCAGSVGATATCVATFVSAGTTCRTAAGPCDVAEACNGSTTTCPADTFVSAASNTVCRAAVGACDVAETCNGVGAACPADAAQPVGTACGGAPNGACDAQDVCAGSVGATATCVATFVSAGTTCRTAAGPCDVAEACNGSTTTCPADAFVSAASNTVCRSAVGACDATETCNGGGAACPADAAQPAGTACGGTPNGACDAQDVCAGSVGVAATCVATFASSGTACSDGSACTAGDACNAVGACVAGSAVSCDDGNACTSESCDPMSGCIVANVPDNTPCDDGSACSTGDRCVAGVCTPSMGVACQDNNDCTANDCDGMSGCLNTALATATPCNDDDACTAMDTCDGNGTCVGGTPVDCDDSNECTNNGCDSTSGCEFTAEPDGTPCTGGVCLSGACDTTAQGGSGGGGAGQGGEGGAGAAGAGGTGGIAGAGGSAGGAGGHGGAGGTSNEGGQGGAGATSSAGGQSATGAGGHGGTAGAGGGTGVNDPEEGCTCRAAGTPAKNDDGLAWLASAVLGVALSRRSSRR